MPFTDTPDGQTHYQNDGCGVKAHNDMQEAKAWWMERPYLLGAQIGGVTKDTPLAMEICEEIAPVIRYILAKEREEGRQQGIREARGAVDGVREIWRMEAEPSLYCHVLNVCEGILFNIDSLLSQQNDMPNNTNEEEWWEKYISYPEGLYGVVHISDVAALLAEHKAMMHKEVAEVIKKVLSDEEDEDYVSDILHELRSFLSRQAKDLIVGVDFAENKTASDVIILCDDCGADFSGSDAVGGLLFGSKAHCPECAPKIQKLAEQYGEEGFIRDRAQEGETFKNFVLRVRHTHYPNPSLKYL